VLLDSPEVLPLERLEAVEPLVMPPDVPLPEVEPMEPPPLGVDELAPEPPLEPADPLLELLDCVESLPPHAPSSKTRTKATSAGIPKVLMTVPSLQR
jgi:hypothetical protein